MTATIQSQGILAGIASEELGSNPKSETLNLEP